MTPIPFSYHTYSLSDEESSDDELPIYQPSTYLYSNVSEMEKLFPSTYMCD